jgi:hypothetical protein
MSDQELSRGVAELQSLLDSSDEEVDSEEINDLLVSLSDEMQARGL